MTGDGEGSAGDRGQKWVAQLFQMIGAYEQSPTTFDGESFMELYARVERAIELSGESESQAFALDQSLFNAVSIAEVGESDLRFVASHALTIHHRYHADYGRGFEQAYKWCEQSRAQPLPDLRFIHTYLLPRLHQAGAMGGSLDVCLFFMERLGRFENLENSPVWDDEQAVDLLKQEPSDITYQLARRRVKYIAENLTKVPNSLEQQLNKDGAFKSLYKDHQGTTPLLSHLLQTYQYMRGESLWKRIANGFSGLTRGLVERMAGEYIAYEVTKRNGAFVVQSVVIVFILLGFVMACYAWALKSQSELTGIERDLEVAQEYLEADLEATRSDAEMARDQYRQEYRGEEQ